MTDKKISDLSANATLAGTEYVELVQSGGNVKALLSAIKTFSNKGESIILAASDETTALTTGAAKVTFRMPSSA
mgnify:FL=1